MKRSVPFGEQMRRRRLQLGLTQVKVSNQMMRTQPFLRTLELHRLGVLDDQDYRGVERALDCRVLDRDADPRIYVPY